MTTHRILPQVTYFVLNEKETSIKISRTNNLKRRLQAVRYQCAPFKITLLGYIESEQELDLHHKFKAYHDWGDWYTYSDEIKTFIASLELIKLI